MLALGLCRILEQKCQVDSTAMHEFMLVLTNLLSVGLYLPFRAAVRS